jgi:predicted O-linked N-acetylglucosamine transferase (SPINDLY family)
MFSTFSHEVYLEADLRNSTSKFYQLAVKAWPHFNYVAPHLLTEKKQTTSKKGKRIKLGVASALFGPSSVTSDFGETMARLPRDVFDVVYVDVRDLRPLESPYLLQRAARGDRVVEIKLAYNEKEWLNEARRVIAALKLDVLLYLDLTMSNKIQRLAMSRLAIVQATSHGHPVTSGIDASVMNYFISWGAAELPLEEAQKHYTEKLVLLPETSLHQYYMPLISKSGVSAVTGMPFKHFARAVLARDFKVPAEGNWYLCMQKPFKRHPLFDGLIAGVLAHDKNGHVLLHDLYNESDEHREIINGRLARAGVDLRRVHFIPTLPHHVLMAFYDQADVVLDSYSAGGCTTTREAIEAGAAIVTLPADYLGGRWSLAYFAHIGVLDTVLIVDSRSPLLQRCKSSCNMFYQQCTSFFIVPVVCCLPGGQRRGGLRTHRGDARYRQSRAGARARASQSQRAQTVPPYRGRGRLEPCAAGDGLRGAGRNDRAQEQVWRWRGKESEAREQRQGRKWRWQRGQENAAPDRRGQARLGRGARCSRLAQELPGSQSARAVL